MEKPALELFTNVTFVKRDEGVSVSQVTGLGGALLGCIFLSSVFFHPASTVCTNTPGDILRYNRNSAIYLAFIAEKA